MMTRMALGRLSRRRRKKRETRGPTGILRVARGTEMKLSAFLVFIILVPTSWAKPVTLSFKTADTDYEVSFDTDKLSEESMRNLILLSPFITNYAGIPTKDFWMGASTVGTTKDKVLFAVPLDSCNKGDSSYIGCQENDISSSHFLHNAEVNLRKSRQGLLWLEHFDYPKEFQRVVDYLREGLAFSIWIEETEFRYFTAWDESILEESHDGVSPKQFCKDSFQRLRSAQSREEKYRIVKTEWANCVNKSEKNNLGIYPIESWEASLKAYGITERYTEKVPD
jgi:hypothetical protein